MITCEACEDVGCNECLADVSACVSCGREYPLDELDEEGECNDCIEDREDRRQLASDYRSMVL